MKQDNVRSQVGVGVGVNVIVCDKSQWKYFGDKQKKNRYVTKALYSKRNNKKKRECESDDFSKFQNNTIHSLVQRLQTGFTGKLKVLNDLFIGFIWNFVHSMEIYIGNVFTHTFIKPDVIRFAILFANFLFVFVLRRLELICLAYLKYDWLWQTNHSDMNVGEKIFLKKLKNCYSMMFNNGAIRFWWWRSTNSNNKLQRHLVPKVGHSIKMA